MEHPPGATEASHLDLQVPSRASWIESVVGFCSFSWQVFLAGKWGLPHESVSETLQTEISSSRSSQLVAKF